MAGSGHTKKELLILKREKDKLEKTLGGIRTMARVPSAVWIVDTKKEHLAVDEARKLGLPVIAILDTNCDPVSYTHLDVYKRQGYGIDADFHRPGELTLSLTPNQDGAITEGYELHRAHGLAGEVLDADAARARVNSPLYRGGWFDPSVALVDPARLAWGLATAVESLGGTIHEGSPATSLEVDGAGVRVTTTSGAIAARRVVVGTNAYPGVLKRCLLYTSRCV